MSKIFKYTSVKDVVNFDGFLPGQKSRVSPNDVTYAVIADETLENGQLVNLFREKDDHGTLALFGKAITSAEDLNEVGVVLQDVKAQEFRTSFRPQFIYEYPENRAVSVLRKGYVYVPVQNSGAVTPESDVYVRTVASEDNESLPVGGIETASGEGLTKLEGAKFTGAYGYPLSGTNDGSTVVNGLTGKTAEIVINFELI